MCSGSGIRLEPNNPTLCVGKWEKHVRLFAGLGAVGQIYRREEVNQLLGRASLLQHGEPSGQPVALGASSKKRKGKKERETEREREGNPSVP
jgi:hypothetical protein